MTLEVRRKKILGNFFTLAFAHKTSQIKQFIMPYQ